MASSTLSLVPRSGGELIVVAIGRISTVHQDIENIEASYRYIEDYLARIYTGPIQLIRLGEQASGMLTNRAMIIEAEELIATGTVDLVIAEDLSRIYRNPRYQFAFVQNAVDVGTRVICIGDNLDTADENWEITMGAAALRHGLHIPDTRRRVRRTATHAFHNGGMVLKIRYGYRKLTLAEAKTGNFGPCALRLAKRTECTPIIRRMMERVLRGERYQTIAEWLNSEGVTPGDYVKSGRWTARLVVDLLDDPILSGLRTFRDTISRPVFRTGLHRAEVNHEPETEFYAALAHVSSEEHAVLREELARRRVEYTAPHTSAVRRNIPRSRTLWPGQSMRCGICGGLMYFSGMYLRCSNSLKRRGACCWNHVQVPARLTQARTITCLLEHIEDMADCRRALLETVHRQLDKTAATSVRCRRRLVERIAALEKQAANLAIALAEGGQLSALLAKLKLVEADLESARMEQTREPLQIAGTDDSIHGLQDSSVLHEQLVKLASESYDFADLLRHVVPEFIVQPVQALDTPIVRPRGKLKLHLEALLLNRAASSHFSGTGAFLHAELDLFDPPDHIRMIPACLIARDEHPRVSLKGLGALLGVHQMTVKRALDYAKTMQRFGASDPYRELFAHPERVSRWTMFKRE